MATKETFEADMKKLDDIVTKLQDGKLPLEEMVKLYEEGVALAKKCRAKLDEYQARLTIIDKAASGESETDPAR